MVAGEEISDCSLIEHLARGDIRFCFPQAVLGVGIGEELKGGLDRFKVLGGEENHVLAPVLRDLDPLVRGRHFFGNLGQPAESRSGYRRGRGAR